MAKAFYRNTGTNQMVFVPVGFFAGNPLWELVDGGGGGGDVTQAELDALEQDTTGPHGVEDFSLLETQDGATHKVADGLVAHSGDVDPHGDRADTTSKIATHSAAIDPHGDRANTTSQINTHNLNTTGVHGIDDTQQMETQTGAAGKVTAHTGAVDPHGDRAYALSAFYAAAPEVLADNPVYGTPGTRAAFIAALDAAEALGKHTVVRIPAGMVIDVGNGLSLAGYSVQIAGAGAGFAASNGNVSVIKATTQTGPVLDFAGWVIPANFFGRVSPLSGVYIQGSGVADPTKVRSGIKLTVMSSATFSDISVGQTGGPCIECAESPGNAVYLCDFERIVLQTPVSAKANDVPYFYANEPNGNRFRGIGLRSMLASADVGSSGAVVVEGNATYPPHSNLFDAWWFEFLHVPTDGTFFHFEGNSSVIRDFQFFDCSKESGATGTSYYRLAAPAASNFGGNTITGMIPGKDSGLTSVDTGVDVQQSHNRIIGVKGYKGGNVIIAAGVQRTHISLGGSLSGASDPAVVDNSGNTTNSYIDEYLGSVSRLGVTQSSGAGTPEGAVTAAPGSTFARTNGGAGATIYAKETGTGNTGWAPLSGSNPDIQQFTSSGTWTKPAGATATSVVEVVLIPGGSGGGSGRRGAAASVSCGGGGGGTGHIIRRTFIAGDLTGTVAVTVGAFGAGGLAVTADDTSGNVGSNGGATSFGTFSRAFPATGGSGGTPTTGSGGAGPYSVVSTSMGLGGSASASGGVGGGANPSFFGAGTGGAGGGVTAADAANNGGPGGLTYLGNSTTGGGVGGVVDTTAPTAGTAATVKGTPGPGAGGGAGSTTTAAQAGAAGANFGGGGGGGGGSRNGNNSGAGGAGGAGYALVVTYI